MKLMIGARFIKRWKQELLAAGDREIGGILFGEHIDDSEFRLIDITIQKMGGNHSQFRRKPTKARKEVKYLCEQHGNDHKRFNYLGEWHSHPNALALPSLKDERTMLELLKHPASHANFLVLLIIRMSRNDAIDLSANTYLPSGHVMPCDIQLESE